MADSTSKEHTPSSRRFILNRLLPVVALLAAGSIILFNTYITSPQAATQISAILGDMLDLPVTISAIRLHGDTLIFTGITVDNPPGFTDKHLVAVDTVSFAPDWMRLLTGQRALRLLGIDNARIDLRKEGSGAWNFERIRKRFSGGKGGAELLIDELRVNNSEIVVNGKGFKGISLKLRQVATKGTAGSTATLSFNDETGNRYLVTGTFRAGVPPEAELSLEAPSLALAGLTKGGTRVAVTGGTGSLRVKATLHEGVVRSSVDSTFTGVAVKIGSGAASPLSGRLQGSATYDLTQDVLKLEETALVLDDILEMRTTGNVNSLKSGLRYVLTVAINRFDIARGTAMLPGLKQTGMKAAGAISAEQIKVTGGVKQGITSVAGMVSLRNLLLARNGRTLLDGVGTDMKFTTAGETIRVAGKLVQHSETGAPLVQQLRAPYALVFTGRMKPESIDLPGFTARVLGMPLSGNFSIRPEASAPFSLSLQLPESTLDAVSYGELSIDAGSAGMSLTLKGAGSTNFNGSLALSAAGLKGSLKGERFALGSSVLKADYTMASGQYSASGNCTFGSASFKDVAAGGSFGFSASDNTLHLEHGAMHVAETSIGFSRLSAVLPGKGEQQVQKGQPLEVKIAGGTVHRGELDLSGISAYLRGSYPATGQSRRFAGTGEIAAAKLLWRSRDIGAPRANIDVSRSGGTITVAGTVLGGVLDGVLTFNQDAATDGVAFDLSLKRAELSQVAQLAGRRGSATVSGGQLTVATGGSYSRKDGFTCRIRGEGSEVAVTGTGGKGVLANAALQFDASLAKGNLKLTDAFFRLGEGATVLMKGDIARALSPQRDGFISCGLSRAPLERIVDPLANGLPRLLQEASVNGYIAAEGRLGFRNGHTTLQGFVELDGAGVDAGTGKLKIEGVSGSIPFSLGFPARRTASPEQSAILKRESYEQQLALFTMRETKGSLVKIGKIAFGPLGFGETSLRVDAAEGIIEALSFTSSLTSGRILGQGYVAFSQGMSYGGDLLLSDLSLQQICALFPNIKGYVSGRVDGIAMFEGQGGGIGGLNGYTYFWTRQGAGEKMLVSKEFLQKLAGKNLQGFFFRDDHPFDKGEVMASLESGYLTFDILDIANTNIFGVRDLKVTVTESQNRIALEHLLDSISQAVSRGKGAAGKEAPAGVAPPAFKWEE